MKTRHLNLSLVALLLFGFALRIYKLGDQSLWYDETVSAFLARQTIPDLIAHTARDIHPPGYYLLLHFWVGQVGHTEFALAYSSLICGVLLMPLIYVLARLTASPHKSVALWATFLTACSPFGVWYAQEVRMYTLGAVLGLLTVYCLLKIYFRPKPYRFPKTYKVLRYYFGYWLGATVGLYSLYYFAFLLIAFNLFLLSQLWQRPRDLRSLLYVNGFVVLGYFPWLPIAWRQMTRPPVPTWRSLSHWSPWSVTLEIWTALSLGQSVESANVWPILLLTLLLFVAGWWYLQSDVLATDLQSVANRCGWQIRNEQQTLLVYLFAPILLIHLLSWITPLYHVRYIFIYSPPFYIFLGAGLTWLKQPILRYICLILLLGSSLFSIQQMHTNPRYQADDYRGAVNFITEHWQPGDAIMVNAGYVYPAFIYYTKEPQPERLRLVPYSESTIQNLQSQIENSKILFQTGTVDGTPQLGWGNPSADFYAMRATETVTALNQLARDFPRLWLLRAYDTVTDPPGLIRAWLAEQTIPLEDHVFSGESNIRVQGFLLNSTWSDYENLAGFQQKPVYFADGLGLMAWYLPPQTWSSGQSVRVKLWWQASARPSVDYKISLKLWQSNGQLAAQGQDNWPGGTLYRPTNWRIGQPVYQAVNLDLPKDLPAGQYWLNVELYHPKTITPLARLDGAAPVVTLGEVRVSQ